MIAHAAPAFDDHTARYIEDASVPFDALRQVATQLAAQLLWQTLDPKSSFGHRAHAGRLGGLLDETAQRLSSMAPPGIVAGHHHHHLLLALKALQTASQAAGELPNLQRRESCDRSVRDGIRHLRHAAHALPGFNLVDLHDCCGARLSVSAIV